MEALGQILTQTADPEVARKHPEPGQHLVDVEQLLALAEAVHHHRDGADFEPVCRQPHEVTRNPLELDDQHAMLLTRSGISTSSSFSTAMQNARLLDWAAR